VEIQEESGLTLLPAFPLLITKEGYAMVTRNGDGNSILRGKRVLICEDEGLPVFQFTKALQSAGMTIVGGARTGKDSVQLAIETSPDVILMDIALNDGIDGIAATRLILAKRPNTLIFGVSAFTSGEWKRQAAEAGMCGFIEKPIDSDTLVNNMAGVIECIEFER